MQDSSQDTNSRGASGAPTPHFSPGLEGVVLSPSRLSWVEGEKGRLTIAGYAVEDLAPHATFEHAAWLLKTDRLPSDSELSSFRAELSRRRLLPEATRRILTEAASQGLDPMPALRAATATFDLAGSAGLEPSDVDSSDVNSSTASALPFSPLELTLLALMPRALAFYDRLRRGLEPVEPEPGLGVAADLLTALFGEAPTPTAERALDTYLVTVCDHGANASTFTARVIVSTGADRLAAILGALGALSGPLHGGAPGPALDMVREIGHPDRAEAILRAKLDAGERLMGFGHRVYQVRDPRASVLAGAAEALYADEASGADRSLYELARHVEETAVALLDLYKPGRRLRTNVEFYTALLLDGLRLPTDLFTPIFAISRTAGWLAHCQEQEAEGKLIRPRLQYVGSQERRWVS